MRVAFFLNLSFTLLEIVGGFLTNSIAILSDALHDLGDSFSLGIAWYLERYSEREADDRFSYGYKRFSLLGAVITSIVLIVGSLFIFSEAIERISDPQETSATGMVILAILGVTVNGIAVLRLRDESSLNAKAVSWHLLEDALGWIAVLMVGITLQFVDAPILDPALSILLTLYVLYNIIGNLKKTLAVFLQAVPEEVDAAEVKKQLCSIDGVLSEHHTHLWSLEGEINVLTSHLVVAESTTREDILRIKQEARALLIDHHFDHITIEIEYGEQDH